MAILHFLESIRSGFLNVIMNILTYLGSEEAFLVVALVMLWCVNKQRGYRMFSIFFTGVALSEGLKILFKIDRPFVKDETLRPIGQANSYSFPSSHTSNAVLIFDSVATFFKKWWWYLISGAAILITGFTRLYLGVHSPADIIGGIALGGILIVLFNLLFKWMDKNGVDDLYLLCGTFVITILAVVMTCINDSDIHVLEAKEGSFKLLGCAIGALLSYYIESKYINYETKAKFSTQILKIGIGIVLVLALKTGLKYGLLILFGESLICDSVRYCILVFFACAVWPMTFKKFAKTKTADEITDGQAE